MCVSAAIVFKSFKPRSMHVRHNGALAGTPMYVGVSSYTQREAFQCHGSKPPGFTDAIDIHAVYDAVTVRTKLLVRTSASDYMVSSTMEVSRESEHMASSRRKRFRPVTLMSL